MIKNWIETMALVASVLAIIAALIILGALLTGIVKVAGAVRWETRKAEYSRVWPDPICEQCGKPLDGSPSSATCRP